MECVKRVLETLSASIDGMILSVLKMSELFF
jgi:hypothetical protein